MPVSRVMLANLSPSWGEVDIYRLAMPTYNLKDNGTGRNPMREDERDRVARQGTQAWVRLKKEKNWYDWLKVGEALQVGRGWAMNQAATNLPQGKAYNMAFAEWLAKYKLDDMDKGDRSRLFSVMDNLPMIEDWRRTLTQTERHKLNHPNAVWRKWKAAIETEPRGEPKRPTLRDSVANLSEEAAAKDQRISELEARLQEAEAARSIDTLDDLRDRMAAIARDWPKDRRMDEIERCMKALGLNIHDWVSTMTIGRKGRTAKPG
jgi:hypothetical protein